MILMEKNPLGSENNSFVLQCLSWLWIISAIIVFTSSAIALIRIKFKMDYFGLFVIIIYNVVFLLELYASVITLIGIGG
jgi:hypothetical protein